MNADLARYRAFGEFKDVSRVDVKRCFVAAQYFRRIENGKARYLRELTRAEFIDRLQDSKAYVAKLLEPQLDEFILEGRYPKRLKMYNSCRWYEGLVFADEVGVWKGAGGLPLDWTIGSLEDTARRVKQSLQSSDTILSARARRAIPRIMPNVDLISRDPYLYPIIAPGATMGRGINGRPHKNFKHMKGDIEDGCMRSIALTVAGAEKLHAFVGLKAVNQ